jgi:AhpD family alkylhydroperoxidase
MNPSIKEERTDGTMLDTNAVNETVYPPGTVEVGRRRKELAPEIHDAFENFSRAVFRQGALPEKTKQLIAVAVAHTTQCPYCIAGHTKLARRKGASDEEVMEAIWVAAEMRAGGAYAHSTIALHTLGMPEHAEIRTQNSDRA